MLVVVLVASSQASVLDFNGAVCIALKSCCNSAVTTRHTRLTVIYDTDNQTNTRTYLVFLLWSLSNTIQET